MTEVKDQSPDYADAIYKLLQFSPPISSKLSRIRGAAWQFDSKQRRQEMFDKGFSLDNPAYRSGAKILSATTNIPLDRMFSKYDNIKSAMQEENDWWMSVAELAGWPEWQLKPKKNKSKESKVKKNKKTNVRGNVTLKPRDVKINSRVTKKNKVYLYK